MSKYINADKFIIPKGTVDDIAKRGVIAIHDLLETQPNADVVEVVRCKDCKFYESFGNKDFHCGECLNVGYDSPTKTVPKDGFCYEAERKETE